ASPHLLPARRHCESLAAWILGRAAQRGVLADQLHSSAEEGSYFPCDGSIKLPDSPCSSGLSELGSVVPGAAVFVWFLSECAPYMRSSTSSVHTTTTPKSKREFM